MFITKGIIVSREEFFQCIFHLDPINLSIKFTSTSGRDFSEKYLWRIWTGSFWTGSFCTGSNGDLFGIWKTGFQKFSCLFKGCVIRFFLFFLTYCSCPANSWTNHQLSKTSNATGRKCATVLLLNCLFVQPFARFEQLQRWTKGQLKTFLPVAAGVLFNCSLDIWAIGLNSRSN